MTLRIIVFSALISLIWMGCSAPPESNELVEKPYFDLSGLIHEQVVLLSILNPTLNKSIEKDGKTEVHENRLDSLQWSAELQLLAQLDINRPRLRDSYTTSESISEDDTKLVSYQLADRGQTGIQYLNIYRDAILDNLLKIEARNQEGNFLYESASVVAMTFEMDDIGDVFLKSYRISEEQTMLFRETAIYNVEGEIEY